MSDEITEEENPNQALGKKAQSRRNLISGAGLAALAAGVGALSNTTASAASKKKHETRFLPKFYPEDDFASEVDITGKFAVVTGASRGIGRATAEALIARGVTVIGTSRDAGSVPNPPAFPLLDLDVTSTASINAFATSLVGHPDYPGSIDILINNGARFIIGTAVPPPIAPDPLGFFMDAIDLGMETVYGGQVRVTNTLLPLMTPAGYSRLLFTVSIAGHGVGGTDIGEANGQSFFHAYYSAKRALLAYANNLRGFLKISGSNIKVSTVNPYFINTGLIDGLNPVFTEPVDGNGNSPFNPVLQQVLDGTRFGIQNGLPASLVADAYMQLVESEDPLPNVIAASEDEPFATQGANALLEMGSLAENAESAAGFGCEHKKSKKSKKSEK